jgi:hypothetical protein
MASSREYESHTTEEKTSLSLQVSDGAGKEPFAPSNVRGRLDSYESSTASLVRQSETRTGGSVRIVNGNGGGQAAATEKRASVERTEVSVSSVSQTRKSAFMGALTNGAPCAAPLSAPEVSDLEELKARVLKKMLEVLHGVRDKEPLAFGEHTKGRMLDLRSAAYQAMDFRMELFSVGADAPQAGTTSGGTLWRKVTQTNVTQYERETTAFQSQGFATTEDGRAIHFDVAFSMSREFTSNYESIKSENVIMTDPLIINLDRDVTSLSGAKFEFDLDSDGQTESVSFAGEGSGFLALDADGNGAIDDGSELFGTQSGDGFADLAAYDDDGNGWIDENDAVYDKLRVWTKGADGADNLLTLKEADVGAIYLDSAGTEFSLKEAATNETQGVIRRTGMYLKESGGVGTLSHVDLRS